MGHIHSVQKMQKTSLIESSSLSFSINIPGSVIGDMTRGRRGSWMLQRTTVNPAITRFTSVAVTGQPPGTRAFLLKPETGRTHQLRVALKSLGSPVLGDQRYANAAEAREVDRAYLHCAALRLTVLGERLQVVCPPAHGAVFASEGFQGVWQGWFPPGMETAHGAWFEDNKLLQSSLE